MSSSTKPLYEIEKQIEYKRHKDRLNTISHQKNRIVDSRNTIQEMHKIRNQSMNYRLNSHELQIGQQNQKLLGKLLDISKRKKSDYLESSPTNQTKIITFNNPARKRRQRQITEMNQMLAERMLTQQSIFDYKSVRKSMQDYERVKKSMIHNKKPNASFFPLIADYKFHPATENTKINDENRIKYIKDENPESQQFI